MRTDFENGNGIHEKPLKRLMPGLPAIHRAKGPVLMRQRNSPRELLAVGLAFVSLVTSVIITSAQPEKNATPKSGSPEEATRAQRRQFAGGPAAGRFVPGFERLQTVLTEEQRTSLREAMEGQRDKMREFEEKIRDARRELLTAGLIGKFDEDAVRQKAMTAAKLDAELTVLRAKAFSQMRPVLSSEQLEKLKSTASLAGRDGEQPAPPRRRSDIPRDEHGLPLKPSATAKSDSSDAPAKPVQP